MDWDWPGRGAAVFVSSCPLYRICLIRTVILRREREPSLEGCTSLAVRALICVRFRTRDTFFETPSSAASH
jgi:hypothetical protein